MLGAGPTAAAVAYIDGLSLDKGDVLICDAGGAATAAISSFFIA